MTHGPRARRTVVAGLCAAAMLGLAACGGGSGDGSTGGDGSGGDNATFKIGALLGLTGPYASLGTGEQESIQLYAKTINEKGGINGHKVEVVVADSGSDESKAVNQFRKLVTQDKVVAVLGPSSSGESIAIKPVSLAMKTPTIGLASSMAIITPVDQAKYMFKHFPSTEDSLKAQLQYVKDQGWKRVAIIASNNGYGQEPVKTLPGLVGEFGLEVVGSATFPPDATDVTSTLSSLAAKKPDVTLVWAVNPANAIVAKNAKAIKYPGMLFNSPGAGTPEYIKVGGAATEGTLVQGSKIAVPDKIPSSDPQYKALQDLLQAWKGSGHSDTPNQFVSNGWDGFVLLDTAITNAKIVPGDVQATRDKIRDALENDIKDVPGINAVYSFTPDNHGPKGIKGLAVLGVKNGAFDLVQAY